MTHTHTHDIHTSSTSLSASLSLFGCFFLTHLIHSFGDHMQGFIQNAQLKVWLCLAFADQNAATLLLKVKHKVYILKRVLHSFYIHCTFLQTIHMLKLFFISLWGVCVLCVFALSVFPASLFFPSSAKPAHLHQLITTSTEPLVFNLLCCQIVPSCR